MPRQSKPIWANATRFFAWLLIALVQKAFAQFDLGQSGIGQNVSRPKWHWPKWIVANIGIGPKWVLTKWQKTDCSSGDGYRPLNFWYKSVRWPGASGSCLGYSLTSLKVLCFNLTRVRIDLGEGGDQYCPGMCPLPPPHFFRDRGKLHCDYTMTGYWQCFAGS